MLPESRGSTWWTKVQAFKGNVSCLHSQYRSWWWSYSGGCLGLLVFRILAISNLLAVSSNIQLELKIITWYTIYLYLIFGLAENP